MNNYFYRGHLTRKRFSQNFLHDKDIIESIVAAIHPQPNQSIVEIGPGLGALTKRIVEYINHITVIEIDRDLAAILATNSVMRKKLNIIQQDVLKCNFTALSIDLGNPLRVFGNLPYNISTQLIFHLFRYTNNIMDMHFMLQKEVVNRLVAIPNSKAYGKLSVIAQYYCQIIKVLEVSRESFRPVPQVDSAMVQLIPYHTPPYLVKDLNKLVIITNLAFNQRRKTIRNSLGNHFTEEELKKQDIDITLRAENLSVDQYCRLSNVLTNRTT